MKPKNAHLNFWQTVKMVSYLEAILAFKQYEPVLPIVYLNGNPNNEHN